MYRALWHVVLCLTPSFLQGWRLDPLLLFGQLLTAGAALSFGVEALRLREIVYKKEVTLAAPPNMLLAARAVHLGCCHLLVKIQAPQL